ncbi:hypothetical protein EDD76_10544 [Kineothrix alysoides]|uniref:Uncharacterized protein n=1 Tax=Kineothrix alysoides TaxID=1469948 RepID=A0A4R1R0P8_9FIRM|nr:hypothetical protein [Kineothrix alysoides]TCL58874.1 hypothetical protein EDD76_10544 [Kineothrix alysoides]
MFRVAIIINENEVAHSAFADSLAVLEKPVTLGDNKKEYYSFVVFDKYNIKRLFKVEDELFLLTFDSLFIATNATNSLDLYNILLRNKSITETFINSGKGVFVSSQKKLSIKSGNIFKSIGFLPDKYDIYIYDRTEKSSAEGVATIACEDPILSYPTKITNQLIEYHCIHNSFMVHKYRSHIVPVDGSQYITLLADEILQNEIPPELIDAPEKHRKLLLRSGNLSERVVVTTMALDWASHDELIENILVYITEGITQFAFVRKSNGKTNNIMSSYILRAKTVKIPFRVYEDINDKMLLELPHNIFVFSPDYEVQEVSNFWHKSVESENALTVYHLVETMQGLVCHHYSNATSINTMVDEVANWLARKFFPELWGRSIWTFNYTLLMMNELNIDYIQYLPYIYEELSKHFTKNNVLINSYDCVVNATCMMLEILYFIFLPNKESEQEIYKQYPIQHVYDAVKDWIYNLLFGADISNQDKVYILRTLYVIGCVDNDANKSEINKMALLVISAYRSANYNYCSNVLLCQIIWLTTQLKKSNYLPENSSQEIIKEIIDVLLLKQNTDGSWRNTSETGEVVLWLFQIITLDDKALGHQIEIVNESILNAIEFIFIKYNKIEYNWENDINATVKSIYALGLYDKINNFSANDFFNYVNIKSNQILNQINIINNTDALQCSLEEIQKREQIIRENLQEKNKLINILNSTMARKKVYKLLFFSSFVTLLILGFMMILVGIGLTDHPEVIKELFSNWRSEFIFGFIGVVLGLIFMGIYGYVKDKIFRNEKNDVKEA